MQMTIHKIWFPLLIIFMAEKLASEKYDPAQLSIAFLFYLTSVFWFIAPYVMGKDIQVPSYTDVLKKGKNDRARFICFLVGICGFIVSLLV